jgi:hypothetical protein
VVSERNPTKEPVLYLVPGHFLMEIDIRAMLFVTSVARPLPGGEGI